MPGRGGRESYLTGKRAELELARRFRRAGWLAVRAPASGRRARRLLYPDILAVRRTPSGCRAVVLEVKARRTRQHIYLPARRVWRLQEMAERAGAQAYIAVKVLDEGRWYIFPLDMLERVQGSQPPRYAITLGLYDRALSLEQLLEHGGERPRQLDEKKLSGLLEVDDTP